MLVGSFFILAIIIAMTALGYLDRRDDQKILQSQSGPDEETPSEMAPQNSVADDCSTGPKTLENGRISYPIAAEYSNLPFLGQIFTAYRCGNDRVSQIQGVKGDAFELGLKLWLKNDLNPDIKLDSKLEKMGFKCTQAFSTEGCYEWETDQIIKINQLMELESYAEKIKADDCRKCG